MLALIWKNKVMWFGESCLEALVDELMPILIELRWSWVTEALFSEAALLHWASDKNFPLNNPEQHFPWAPGGRCFSLVSREVQQQDPVWHHCASKCLSSYDQPWPAISCISQQLSPAESQAVAACPEQTEQWRQEQATHPSYWPPKLSRFFLVNPETYSWLFCLWFGQSIIESS